MTETTATARYIDTAEVAKMIRTVLKREFPGVKFSVRSNRYAGGSSIDINWTDGPTGSSVESRVNAFAGGRFDGMIDLAYNASSWYCPEHGPRTAEVYGHSYSSDEVGTGFGNGPVESRCCTKAELVQFGADYVHASRTLSPEFTAELGAKVAKQRGLEIYDPHHFDGYEFASTDLYRLSRDIAR